MTRARAAGRLTCWLLILSAVLAALIVLGHGSHSTPPLLEPSRWGRWADAQGAVPAAMALLRLAALACTAYLWAVTALTVVAALRGTTLHHAFVHRLTGASTRRLLVAMAGTGISAVVVLGTTATVLPRGPVVVTTTAPPSADAHHATEHELPASSPPATADATAATPTTPASTPPPTTDAGGVAVEREVSPTSQLPATSATSATTAPTTLPPDTPAPASSTTTAPPGSTSRPALAPATPARPTSGASAALPAPESPAATPPWTVAPGENFWFKAAEVLTQAWGRPPTDAEIVPYWHTLIEANRSALADPANPDLIFPGQRFSVPPPG